MRSEVEEEALMSMEHARGRNEDINFRGESVQDAVKALPLVCLRSLMRWSHVLLTKPFSG